MKTLMLLATIAGAMSAQDFHGVTVGGSADWPTIINNSAKPVMGYQLVRHTTTGDVAKSLVLDVDWIAKDTLILPGQERSALGLAIGFRSKDEPSLLPQLKLTLGYSLVAVLFADGSFIGPDDIRQGFSDQLSRWRSLARDTQYLADKYTILEEDRRSFRTGRRTNRATLADVLMGIRDAKGEDESEAALARLAALPDVMQGENQ